MELIESLPARKKKINIKKEVLKYLRNWYWILLSMLLFYIASKIYLRYTEPQYLSKTTLQFPESKAKGNTTLSDLQTLGTGLSGNNELQAETVAVISKPILSRVVENLNLNVSFYGKGTIKETELYSASPIRGKILEITAPNFSSAVYTFTAIDKDTYRFSEGSLLKGKSTFKYGAKADLPFGKIVIEKRPDYTPKGSLKVVFRSTKNLVSYLEKSVNVSLPENKGLLMDLNLTGPIPKKSEDILNEISAEYNVESVKDRNEEAQNTQDFINDRLAIISGDLSGIENEKESFKKTNQITDLDAQANIALNNSNESTKQILNYSTQLDLINSIYNESSKETLLPSNMGLSSATEAYIAKYNDLMLTRNRTLKQATPQNPSVIQMNKDISEIRNLIRKGLVESRETLQLQIAQLQGQLNVDRSRINNYPTQEKVFRSIERQQNLKEQLYLYLLQKREENAITLAVTAPKAKVLNPAYTLGIVKPNRQQITLGSLGAGFLLPVLLMYATYTFNNKVQSKDEIQSHISNATVIAEIPQHEEEGIMVSPNDFSVFAESFRILTSNLKFIFKAQNDKNAGGVVLVTSSIKGEGKTTISMNTALTLAGTSKVLIIGADIRNPQLQRFVKDNKKGLTDYLISDDNQVDSYIVNSGISKNLDVLFSGAIAPNPNDLLDMNKFDVMIEDLRKKYDYIVMDTAPVMLVSDTLHLIEISDVVLYVIKAGYTDNEMLDFAEEFRNNNQIRNMAFVLNNVKLENTRYGNKYGYYHTKSDKDSKGFFKNIFGLK